MTVVDARLGLVEKVRTLVNDQDMFLVEDVLSFLEQNKEYVEGHRLTPYQRVQPHGTIYNIYTSKPYSQWGSFEIVDSEGNDVPTTSYDAYNGVFFVNNVPPPLYISGDVYDVYSTAADILTVMAMRLPVKFDVQADGADFSFGQQLQNLLTLAQSYRAMAKIKGVDIDGLPDR